MNDQERQIIADIFKRLEQTAAQTRDPDAERLIAEKVRVQPYAPYAMAQALYVQEEALKSLNGQIEQLRAENEQLQNRGSSGGGIFSSIFGGGQQRPANQGMGQPGFGAQPQQGGPWGQAQQGGPGGQQGGPWGGQQPQQPQQQPGGGGFLRGALTTAAGVAGGMVVGSALMNAFSGGGHSTLGSLSPANTAALGGATGQEAGVQNASFDDGGSAFQDAGYDDSGSVDVGGDDSWS